MPLEGQLWAAAWDGREAEVRRLIAEHADLNERGFLGMSPLHCAAMQGHQTIIVALVEAGADTAARDNDGCTPMDLAHPDHPMVPDADVAGKNVGRLAAERWQRNGSNQASAGVPRSNQACTLPCTPMDLAHPDHPMVPDADVAGKNVGRLAAERWQRNGSNQASAGAGAASHAG
ncbi:hypothetical protein T484DRAFT_1830277 [Baffinella frigidus]|nr:hypothetical protein T484DRAFT_1830277 [Cryptophyta sp. CCMP2293]